MDKQGLWWISVVIIAFLGVILNNYLSYDIILFLMLAVIMVDNWQIIREGRK